MLQLASRLPPFPQALLLRLATRLGEGHFCRLYRRNMRGGSPIHSAGFEDARSIVSRAGGGAGAGGEGGGAWLADAPAGGGELHGGELPFEFFTAARRILAPRRAAPPHEAASLPERDDIVATVETGHDGDGVRSRRPTSARPTSARRLRRSPARAALPRG